MSHHKNLKEAINIIQSEGLVVVSVIPGNHHKIIVEHNGVRRTIVHATSKSCPRAMKNFRTDVRHLLRKLIENKSSGLLPLS